MWETRSVELNVSLPRDIAAQLEEVQRTDPELLSRMITYGLTRRAIYRQLKGERQVAASLLWLLSGDGMQRAVAAWHFGWQPAQDASGTDWMPPHLAEGLDQFLEKIRGQLPAKALDYFADLDETICIRQMGVTDYSAQAETVSEESGRRPSAQAAAIAAAPS